MLSNLEVVEEDSPFAGENKRNNCLHSVEDCLMHMDCCKVPRMADQEVGTEFDRMVHWDMVSVDYLVEPLNWKILLVVVRLNSITSSKKVVVVVVVLMVVLCSIQYLDT